ncbi:hypothetical protein Barba22A_gp056 [Rheinheimera phage vB_RspM_Barba22A]|jgi:hypothetical protein|uniref:Uncharacterized protein n=84 Tax=Barbavirus TaxID=2733095 RepID=A0A7G9VRT6_9CAUD|nr:hypothetical protein HOV44_gp060 [Rheinheimera phage Barba5S]YP_009822796.1 hypothetical protein HOV45_gp060 [Rheinheimera phage Barba8S]YP_009822933.1 hypothetical protein HOV46_gp056 [Rheinheimera phage vB_RspM_Barba18A]YP_009823077.1 hypothetical protein HOV47_gp064 [Rheinheimera phage vB_RspM_Barba19A]YP_009823212.1 hypothetical protein HOV48_gp056 [Rheinheimera phage Barba21A]QCQ57907.1 hypothetical protein Barba1A_gp056 [Rheinheimera phage vB_RspM_Barba1A]QCQ58043.1 hypothetical prot
MNYDQQAREDYRSSPKSIYFWLLAASYLYYHEPHRTPLLSDACFDKMCKYLLSNFDTLSKHSKLSHLVTQSHLQAGSFYDILDNDYPVWLVRMAQYMSDRL